MSPNWVNDQFDLPHGAAGLPPGLNFQSVVNQNPVMPGSNPSGYEPMPWNIWKMIYGNENPEGGGLPQHWATSGQNPYGYSQVPDPNTGNSYYGMNPGNTQGGPTSTNTNWVSTPWGNVPMANLNNPQASMFSMFGNKQNQGPGTGVPTQKVGGAIVGGLTNLFVPGLGFLTGPLARLLIKQLQQSGGQPGQPKPPPMPHGSVSLPVRGAPSPTGRGESLTGSDWFKNMFSGLPPGTTENRPWEEKGGSMSAYGGAPTFNGPSSTPGPQWTGGSIFGGRGYPSVVGGGNPGNLGGSQVVNPAALSGMFMGRSAFSPNAWAQGSNSQQTLQNALGSEAFLRGNTGMTPFSLDTIKAFKQIQNSGRLARGSRIGRGIPPTQTT